jgi:2-polyprenyl-3-methyl-5-hydroxy-6-metoxy-1,4-benzoquinol methylase
MGDETISYRYTVNFNTPDAILPTYDMGYLWSPLKSVIDSRDWPDRRAFDLGCGNGATCKMLSSLAFDTVGVDASDSGIAIAQANGIKAYVGSAYDDLAATYGTFPLVVCLEVIEHCMNPRRFIKTFLSLIAPGGIGFLSTPYHGYLKNLVLAVSGKMDSHFGALWDGGHVKFFSVRTLRELIKEEAGTANLQLLRVGRIIPAFAKSMVAIVQKSIV